jgi:hypothetical protein
MDGTTWKSRSTWECNIKMNLKGIMSHVYTGLFSITGGVSGEKSDNFLTSLANLGVSRTVLVNGFS